MSVPSSTSKPHVFRIHSYTVHFHILHTNCMYAWILSILSLDINGVLIYKVRSIPLLRVKCSWWRVSFNDFSSLIQYLNGTVLWRLFWKPGYLDTNMEAFMYLWRRNFKRLEYEVGKWKLRLVQVVKDALPNRKYLKSLSQVDT